MKQLLITAALFGAILACAQKVQPTPPDGQKIYKQSCTFCHGIYGSLGVSGPDDLTISKLTVEERIGIIKNGRGQMKGFVDILSDAEIEAVANFTLTL